MDVPKLWRCVLEFPDIAELKRKGTVFQVASISHSLMVVS